jgi:hypothetical protein
LIKNLTHFNPLVKPKKGGSMFKKVALSILLTLLLATGAMAGIVSEELIPQTNLTISANTTSSGPVYVQDFSKISFIVYNDETGSSINTTMTMTGSYDGETWLSQSFNDLASPSTLVTSEIFTADTNYFCWLTPISTMPLVNITFITDATAAGNYSKVTTYIMGEK